MIARDGRDEATESKTNTCVRKNTHLSRVTVLRTYPGIPLPPRPPPPLSIHYRGNHNNTTITKHNTSPNLPARQNALSHSKPHVHTAPTHLRSPRARLLAPRAPAPPKELEDVKVAPQSSLAARPAIPRAPITPSKLDDVHVASEGGGRAGRLIPRAVHAVGPP